MSFGTRTSGCYILSIKVIYLKIYVQKSTLMFLYFYDTFFKNNIFHWWVNTSFALNYAKKKQFFTELFKASHPEALCQICSFNNLIS